MNKAILKYIIIAASASFILVLGAYAYILVFAGVTAETPTEVSQPRELMVHESGSPSDTEDKQDTVVVQNRSELLRAPRKTTALILGVDQSKALSDVIIACCFDSYTGRTDLISIPRDTYTELDDADIRRLRDDGHFVPSGGVMKLTELHSYAGIKDGHTYVQKYAEKILGVSFDYYVEIDTSAFREIVDAVGPIEMDIPKGGLYYNDPIQDLHISIPEGRQQLDGRMAEGVVRYRHYAMGDIDRIGVQQSFMREFFTQVVDKDQIMSNLQTYFNTFLNYVSTDFPAVDLPKYITPLMSLDTGKIQFHTIPHYLKEDDPYVYYNPPEVRELISRTFNDYGIGLTDEQKQTRITVQNGGCTDTVLEAVVTRLTAAGYENIKDGGDYEGRSGKQTRIFTTDKEYAEIIKDYLTAPSVETVDPDEDKDTIPARTDVLIVLGSGEK